MEVIITAILTEVIALATCIINNKFQHNKTIALFDYKLDELTKKVEKHNSVIERTYELEKIAEIHSEKIKVANNRIKDLEDGAKE